MNLEGWVDLGGQEKYGKSLKNDRKSQKRENINGLMMKSSLIV